MKEPLDHFSAQTIILSAHLNRVVAFFGLPSTLFLSTYFSRDAAFIYQNNKEWLPYPCLVHLLPSEWATGHLCLLTYFVHCLGGVA